MFQSTINYVFFYADDTATSALNYIFSVSLPGKKKKSLVYNFHTLFSHTHKSHLEIVKKKILKVEVTYSPNVKPLQSFLPGSLSLLHFLCHTPSPPSPPAPAPLLHFTPPELSPLLHPNYQAFSTLILTADWPAVKKRVIYRRLQPTDV